MIELINRQEVIDTVKGSIITRTCYTPDDPEVNKIINELSSIPIRGIKITELINKQEVIDAVKESIITHLCYTLDDPEVAGIIKDLQNILVIGELRKQDYRDEFKKQMCKKARRSGICPRDECDFCEWNTLDQKELEVY